MDMEKVLQAAGVRPEQVVDAHTLRERLSSIENDYIAVYPKLFAQGNAIAQLLQSLDSVHALRMGVVSPADLLADLARAWISPPGAEISVATYVSPGRSLISVLVLYESIDDWRALHGFIMSTWKTAGEPVAFVDDGDPMGRVSVFRQAGCRIDTAPRCPSVRYTVPCAVAGRTVEAVLDVRCLVDDAFDGARQALADAGISTPMVDQYREIVRSIGALVQNASAGGREAVAAKAAKPPSPAKQPPALPAVSEVELSGTRALHKPRASAISPGLTAAGEQDTELAATVPLRRSPAAGGSVPAAAARPSDRIVIKTGEKGEVMIDGGAASGREGAARSPDEMAATVSIRKNTGNSKNAARGPSST